MPHVNPTLPNDGETADAADISVPFLALLAIFNGHIGPDNIEPGSMPWSIMDNFTDSIPASAMKDSGNLELYREDTFNDFVAKGCEWAHISGLNGSMTSGVAYINAKRLKVDAVGSHAFPVSKDTYVSISGTGVVGYTSVANDASAPSLGSGAIWVAKIVTDATKISKVVTNGIDSNGNIIRNQSASIDTGWVDIGTGAGFTAAFGSRPGYRMVNGIIYLRGVAQKTSGNIANADYPFGSLPSSLLPVGNKYFIQSGAAGKIVRFIIKDSTNLRVDGVPAENTSWVSIDGINYSLG